MDWRQQRDIMVYDSARVHPALYQAYGTADDDVYAFHIQPAAEWQVEAFRLFPGEAPLRFRHRRVAGVVEAEVFLAAVAPAAEPLTKPDWAYRISLWLATPAEMDAHDFPPTITEMYDIRADLTACCRREMGTGQVVLGIYTCFWGD